MPLYGGVLRHRDFRLLWAGQTVSTLGAQTCALAFPLLALHLTDSPARAGLLGFVAGLPGLVLQLPAGALVDRWHRRTVMIACDLGRLALVVGVALAVYGEVLGFAGLVAAATVHAALGVLFALAQAAALPRTVPSEDVPRAIGVNQTGMAATTLGGQPLGGWLFGLAPALPFAANAVSYAVSLLTLLGIRGRLDAGTGPLGRRSLRRDIGTGVRYVRDQPLLRALTLLGAAITLLSGGFTLVVIVLLQRLGSGPEQIGMVLGGCGLAGLTGAALTPWVLARVRAGWVYLAALGGSAVLACALASAPSTLWAALAAAGIVALGPPVTVVLQVARVRTIPPELFARVRSVETTAATATGPVASLLAGIALAHLGPATTCALIGAGLLVVTATAAAVPAVRRMRDTG